MELEQEFEQYKALHKYAILKARIMQYFIDLEANQVDIPVFMRNNPEQKADIELRRLASKKDNFKEFNRLYELAYADLAPSLD